MDNHPIPPQEISSHVSPTDSESTGQHHIPKPIPPPGPYVYALVPVLGFLILATLVVRIMSTISERNRNTETRSGISPTRTPEATITPSLPATPTETPPVGTERNFPATGVKLTVPAGWTAEETTGSENAVRVSDGRFVLEVVRNPLFTGGGRGLMFDGVGSDSLPISRRVPILLDGRKVMKLTVIHPTDPRADIGAPDSEMNVFGGSVIESSEDSWTSTETNGSTYLIKYSYEQDGTLGVVSVDDFSYQKAETILDEITESIVFE